MSHTYDYPRPAVTVDLIVIAEPTDDESQILLVKRGKEPYKGLYALPGGFLNINETGEEAALREFKEETGGVLPEYTIVQFWGVQDNVDRDPRGRVISLVYIAQFIESPFPVKGADDAEEAKWFCLCELANLQFAFDHKEIINKAIPNL